MSFVTLMGYFGKQEGLVSNETNSFSLTSLTSGSGEGRLNQSTLANDLLNHGYVMKPQ